jgi:hypothetical protein
VIFRPLPKALVIADVNGLVGVSDARCPMGTLIYLMIFMMRLAALHARREPYAIITKVEEGEF